MVFDENGHLCIVCKYVLTLVGMINPSVHAKFTKERIVMRHGKNDGLFMRSANNCVAFTIGVFWFIVFMFIAAWISSFF